MNYRAAHAERRDRTADVAGRNSLRAPHSTGSSHTNSHSHRPLHRITLAHLRRRLGGRWAAAVAHLPLTAAFS